MFGIVYNALELKYRTFRSVVKCRMISANKMNRKLPTKQTGIVVNKIKKYYAKTSRKI